MAFQQTKGSRGDVLGCRLCGEPLEQVETGQRISGLGYELHTVDRSGSRYCHPGRYHAATWLKTVHAGDVPVDGVS